MAARETSNKSAGGPPWVLIGGIVAVAAVAALALYPTAGPETDAVPEVASSAPTPAEANTEAPAATRASATAPEAEATVAQFTKPPADAAIPPLPFIPNMVPRPAEVISEVYEYAARHPDVLEFVPCFCGCETAGHRANAHCFVKSRNDDGTVREWEQHGMGCAVCIDVARDSMQLRASGASVSDVRSAIEAKYVDRFPRMTPTPEPPAE